MVIDVGILRIVLVGWPLAAAGFTGGILMVILIARIFRLTRTPRLVQMAREHAEGGALGRMEGHAAMDMSVEGGPFLRRLFSARGFTAVSHLFVMDWASVWGDVLRGFLIAGALAAWVPESFWQAFFLTGNPTPAKLVRPVVRPLIAIISFGFSVCNVPLAACLWRRGLRCRGVGAF